MPPAEARGPCVEDAHPVVGKRSGVPRQVVGLGSHQGREDDGSGGYSANGGSASSVATSSSRAACTAATSVPGEAAAWAVLVFRMIKRFGVRAAPSNPPLQGRRDVLDIDGEHERLGQFLKAVGHILQRERLVNLRVAGCSSA